MCWFDWSIVWPTVSPISSGCWGIWTGNFRSAGSCAKQHNRRICGNLLILIYLLREFINLIYLLREFGYVKKELRQGSLICFFFYLVTSMFFAKIYWTCCNAAFVFSLRRRLVQRWTILWAGDLRHCGTRGCLLLYNYQYYLSTSHYRYSPSYVWEALCELHHEYLILIHAASISKVEGFFSSIV